MKFLCQHFMPRRTDILSFVILNDFFEIKHIAPFYYHFLNLFMGLFLICSLFIYFLNLSCCVASFGYFLQLKKTLKLSKTVKGFFGVIEICQTHQEHVEIAVIRIFE